MGLNEIQEVTISNPVPSSIPYRDLSQIKNFNFSKLHTFCIT